MSRRGALALVGSSALGVAVLTAGQTIGGITRQTVLSLPRRRTRGDGSNDFPINKTAAAAGIGLAAIGAERSLPSWEHWMPRFGLTFLISVVARMSA